MSSISPKKPSLLGLNSPRSSPFRRPESPVPRSPNSNQLRPVGNTPTGSPSRIAKAPSPFQSPEPTASPVSSIAPAIFSAQASVSNARPISSASTVIPFNYGLKGANDPLAKLNPVQVREMRESFQVLDRNNDGQVTREDVAEILGQLGLDASASSLSPYFPPSNSQNINLSTYLSTLSSFLGEMSRPDELSAAFSAFDVDDSGQIDVDELRDALLHTPSENGGRPMTEREIERAMESFTSRRVLGKNTTGKGRGDVFRYTDFIAEIQGGSKASEPEVAKA